MMTIIRRIGKFYIQNSLTSVSCVLLLLILQRIHYSSASWWLLGTDRNFYLPYKHPSSPSHQHHNQHQQEQILPLMSDIDPEVSHNNHHCGSFPYFVEKQKFLCKKSEKVFPTIIAGARLGIQECQFQLQSYRWNCSIIQDAINVFGEVLGVRSREKAYVHAISAASLAYEVTKACARGELDDCACDEKVRGRNTKGNWQWGGCSEVFEPSCHCEHLLIHSEAQDIDVDTVQDIGYGAWFSKEFADATETKETSEELMNLHNNEAGRRLLKTSMNITCKCHGVSGSCTMKVCWRVLPTFRYIGEKIIEKFEGAFHVKPSLESVFNKKNGVIPADGHHPHHNEHGRKFRLKPILKQMKKPTKKDLVFIDESPDYCEQNSTLQVLGTRGRVCNRTSNNADGCRILCCGRGYQTMIREGVEKCNCQFVWCCKVKCDLCPYRRDEFICN